MVWAEVLCCWAEKCLPTVPTYSPQTTWNLSSCWPIPRRGRCREYFWWYTHFKWYYLLLVTPVQAILLPFTRRNADLLVFSFLWMMLEIAEPRFKICAAQREG